MASLRLYTLVYVLLMALATGKVLFADFFGYWVAGAGILGLAVIKTSLIAGYFQHLREEPRPLTYLMLSALFAVFLLTMAASYSIQ